MVLAPEYFHRGGRSTQLVVLIHGWLAPPKRLAGVRAAVEHSLPDADLFIPSWEPDGALSYFASAFSNTDVYELTDSLVRSIDKVVKNRAVEGAEYQKIILVGNSMGGLLARAVFVRACGESDGRFRTRPSEWADRVERIILIAGMNRGWSIFPRPKRMRIFFAMWLAAWLTGLALLGQARLIRSVQRGRPFVVDLRVRWIELSRRGRRMPLVVQLLGKKDDLVSTEDTVDLQCGQDFVYLDVPDTGHRQIVEYSGAVGEIRREVFLKALLTPPDALVRQWDRKLLPDPQADSVVKRVVFLIHGMRDVGHWTATLAEKIRTCEQAQELNVRPIRPSYGYFPMLKFLVGVFRQRNVLWFMDRYIEALAQFPNARSFSFVGHSNGTYLLASALQRYVTTSFDRVVLAGSVVTRDFPWKKFASASRVGAVRNYVATNDCVVAVGPGLFELLGSKELGTAGHNGFCEDTERLNEVAYVEGGHGAAIGEDNHEAIIAFVLGDDQPAVNPALKRDARRNSAVLLGRLCWLVWLIAIGILAAIPRLAFHYLGWTSPMAAGVYVLALIVLMLTI